VTGRSPFKVTHAAIAADWDPARNPGLGPADVSANSKDRVWWTCEAGHTYQVSVCTRVRTGGCKICNRPKHAETVRRAKLNRSIRLSDARPDLMAQWDVERNELEPHEVSEKSHRLVWWTCDKGHSWQSTPQRRARGDGCPVCARATAGDRVRSWRLRAAGQSLAEARPDLVAEWVFDANDKTPLELTPKSNYKAAWRCRYGHEWRATVVNRTHNASGCPYCAGQSSRLEVFLLCELRSIYPQVEWRAKLQGIEADIFLPMPRIAIEVDGDYWHTRKHSADRRKTAALEAQGLVVVRVRDSRLPAIEGRVVQYSVPQDMMRICLDLVREVTRTHPFGAAEAYLSEAQQRADAAYRQMIARLPAPPPGATLEDTHPAVAAEWDFGANAPLTPDLFPAGSEQRLAWICAGGHRWNATIKNRTMRQSGCPDCSRAEASDRVRQLRAKQLGSLEAANPAFLSMWDCVANETLDPSQVAATSGLAVHWRCEHGHRFAKSPSQMAKDHSCPQCRSLSLTHPALASEWDIDRNEGLVPASVTPGSGRRVWWKCAHGHSWRATVAMRVSGTGCPVCFEQRRSLDAEAAAARRTNQLLSEYAPEWLTEWDAELNGQVAATSVPTRSDVSYWWRCERGHSFQKSPRQRSQGVGCPECANLARAEAVRRAKLARSRSLRDNYPDIAADWHSLRNGGLTADDISANSHRMVWWQCSAGHEWQQTPNARVTLARRGSSFSCPSCSGRDTRRVSS
jgi:hypothetical protein